VVRIQAAFLATGGPAARSKVRSLPPRRAAIADPLGQIRVVGAESYCALRNSCPAIVASAIVAAFPATASAATAAAARAFTAVAAAKAAAPPTARKPASKMNKLSIDRVPLKDRRVVRAAGASASSVCHAADARSPPAPRRTASDDATTAGGASPAAALAPTPAVCRGRHSTRHG